jgi:hypothetical protein
VVEHLTQNPKIEGSNTAFGTVRELLVTGESKNKNSYYCLTHKTFYSRKPVG